MRKPILLLFLAFLLAATALTGDTSPSTAKLIEQLGNKDFTKRERASQMLQARGPSVLPALRQALKHPDAEVRRRVGALIPVLEAVAALAPKRITLDAQQQPLADILKEIEKQTGYKLAAHGAGPNERCTIQLRALPFWEALEQVGATTGRAVTVSPRQDGIQLDKHQRRPFVVHSGPFRLEALHFHEDRDLDFTQPGKGKELGHHDHLLRLTVSVLAEPKFILLTAGPAQVEAALDEEGKSLLSAPPEERSPRYLVGPRQDFQHPASIFLRGSSRRTRRIKELRGFIPVKVVVARKRVVVTEKVLHSKGTKCRIRDGVLEINQADQYLNGSLIYIDVPAVRGCTADWWRRRFHLEDARGNRYEANGGGSQELNDVAQLVSIQYLPSEDPKVGPPSKLIVEDWTILDHTIPFHFKDVPLP